MPLGGREVGMRLFKFPKRNPGQYNEDGPMLRIVRIIIIALLFCVVLYGFWLNSERQMQRVQAPNTQPLQ